MEDKKAAGKVRTEVDRPGVCIPVTPDMRPIISEDMPGEQYIAIGRAKVRGVVHSGTVSSAYKGDQLHVLVPSEWGEVSTAADSITGWCKNGPPPADWFQVPIEGQLKDLTRWCGETDEQTIRNNNGKSFWVCKISRKKFSIYFPSQSRFAGANGRKLAEEQAAKDTQSQPKPFKARDTNDYR